MPDCYKVSDYFQGAPERENFSSIAQDQWNGRQNMCKRMDTAAEHLPSLSLAEDKVEQIEELLAKVEQLLREVESGLKGDFDGERSNDGSEYRPGDGSGWNSEHRSERRWGGHCPGRHEPGGYSDDQPDDYYDHSDGGGSDYPSEDWSEPDHETPAVPDHETPAVPDTSIYEMTQLSEQLLPVHMNGSYPSPEKWEPLHAANVQRAKNAAANGSDLVFFGDSITEAMGYNPAAMQPFKDNFGSLNPTALGVGGDGTKQLLYRLNHGEMQGNPKAVVMSIGTNDIGSMSTEDIVETVERNIESVQLRSPGSKVVLMGVLPRTDASDPDNARVRATNEALSRLATAGGAVRFVNLHDSFLDANGKQRAELYQQDKLHLSPAGYKTWADGLKDSIQNINDAPAPTRDGSDHENLEDGLTTLDVEDIRGVNLSGAEWGKNSDSDTQYWPSTEELDYFKSKGMNSVRLMLSWEQLQPKLNGPLNTAEMNRLHQFLRDAEERGMKVLVTGGSFARYTLNHGPNGQGADGQVNGTRVGDSGVPVSAMQDFWVRMVEHINADPAAAKAVGGWDLTNEPHTMNGTWPKIATAVHAAIRNTGDDHTIVIEGDQWARDFSGLEELARKDKNIAFEAHTYWDNGSGGYANESYPGDPNVGVNHIRPFVEWLKANNARGFVGEWGVPTDSTAWAPAVSNFIDYLEDNRMGNMVWAGGRAWQPGYKLNVQPRNGQDRAIMKTIVEANMED